MNPKLGAAMLLLVVATGCGSDDSPARAISTPGSYGSPDTPTSTKAATKAPAAAPGEVKPFVLTLTDRNGLHPPRIPVLAKGPRTMLLLSDQSGRVEIDEPGTYTVEVVTGCHEHVEVFSGGSGRAGVPVSGGGAGALSVDWRHRYAPRGPVEASDGPDWPAGEAIELRYGIADRCTGNDAELTPKASVETFAFHPNGNLRVLGSKLIADAKGYGTVTVLCTKAGDPGLLMKDKHNPPDTFDVIKEVVSPGFPRCSSG